MWYVVYVQSSEISIDKIDLGGGGVSSVRHVVSNLDKIWGQISLFSIAVQVAEHVLC